MRVYLVFIFLARKNSVLIGMIARFLHAHCTFFILMSSVFEIDFIVDPFHVFGDVIFHLVTSSTLSDASSDADTTVHC